MSAIAGGFGWHRRSNRTFVRVNFRRKFIHVLLVAAITSAVPANAAPAGVTVPVSAAFPADAPHSAAYRAFDRYIQLTEERVLRELAPGGAFLHVDSLSADDRDAAYAKLRGGDVRIEALTTLDRGEKIVCSGCMIQHWVGIIFIPCATLNQTLELMQDYDHQAEFYAPDVTRAKILSHSGDDFSVFMRFHRAMVITVVLDTEHRVHYQRIDATHAASRAVSTRVQEVGHAGAAGERDLAEGQDNGYLWRINNYWRFLQRDGGTYVQCESVSLSRDIPAGFAWLVAPFAESIPRESLRFTLEATRKHLSAARSAAAKQ
jgi:hypothetical protein